MQQEPSLGASGVRGWGFRNLRVSAASGFGFRDWGFTGLLLRNFLKNEYDQQTIVSHIPMTL